GGEPLSSLLHCSILSDDGASGKAGAVHGLQCSCPLPRELEPHRQVTYQSLEPQHLVVGCSPFAGLQACLTGGKELVAPPGERLLPSRRAHVKARRGLRHEGGEGPHPPYAWKRIDHALFRTSAFPSVRLSAAIMPQLGVPGNRG